MRTLVIVIFFEWLENCYAIFKFAKPSFVLKVVYIELKGCVQGHKKESQFINLYEAENFNVF